MDSPGATAPLVVLGVAVLGLLLVALTTVLLQRSARRAPAHASTAPVVQDDLAAFHTHPPGSPGAPARVPSTTVPTPLASTASPGVVALADAPPLPVATADDGVGVTRFLLALAALALALVAAAAAVAIAAPAARADRPASPPRPSRTATASAQLSFDYVVLEQQAVGVTITQPAASVTTAGHRALLHLRLPTWNCLAPDIPEDPTSAGCVPSVTEYGDLPSPALFSSDGKALLLQGRVPTYTRPNGSAPLYTGRVYDVTLTVTPGRRLAPGRYVADGRLTLGTGTARTDGDPALNVLTHG